MSPRANTDQAIRRSEDDLDVVAKRNVAIFSLGRLPENAKGRERAENIAAQIRAHLGGLCLPGR